MDGTAAGTNVAAESQDVHLNNVHLDLWSSLLCDYFNSIGQPQIGIDHCWLVGF